MNWYLAKVVYRIICGDGYHKPQFDEQLRLIQASDKLEAYSKAREIGYNEQDSFLNDNQRLIEWKFIDVSELHQVNALIDGAELYSKVTETENGDLYVEIIKKRAAHIRMNIENNILQTF